MIYISIDIRIKEELQRLAKRHNVSYPTLLTLYLSGAKNGFSPELILVGLRFSCSQSSGITEYFTKEDVAILLDCSLEEAEQKMIDTGNAFKIEWLK